MNRKTASWLSISLPYDLTPIGMTGCVLFTDLALVFPLSHPGRRGTWDTPIPVDANLLGGNFYQQGFIVDVPANPLGATLSNLGRGVIGSRNQ